MHHLPRTGSRGCCGCFHIFIYHRRGADGSQSCGARPRAGGGCRGGDDTYICYKKPYRILSRNGTLRRRGIYFRSRCRVCCKLRRDRRGMCDPVLGMGRASGSDAAARLAGKHPRISAVFTVQDRSPLFASLSARLFGVISGDIISYYFGASGVRFLPFLIGSICGVLPGLVTVTVLGTRQQTRAPLHSLYRSPPRSPFLRHRRSVNISLTKNTVRKTKPTPTAETARDLYE